MINDSNDDYPVNEFDQLDSWSQLLLKHAMRAPEFLGRRSAFRKFGRRNLGRKYCVRTKFGFQFSGVIGDSVDNQIAVWGEFEAAFSRFIADHASEWKYAIDLGCNVGYFSCLLMAANPNLQLLCIDANKLMTAQCERNLTLNQYRAIIENCAVGSEPGRLVFSIPKGRHSLGTLGTFSDRTREEVEQFEVEVKRLDQLVADRFPRIDFLKIDIEGFEPEVFRSLPTELTAKIGMIAFEYSELNLTNCGFNRDAFSKLAWLNDFQLYLLDESSAKLVKLTAISEIDASEATVIAVNKTRK